VLALAGGSVIETTALEAALIELVGKLGPIPIEDAMLRLEGCSWNQLFLAIDRLSRQRTMVLRQTGRCTYTLSLIPARPPLDGMAPIHCQDPSRVPEGNNSSISGTL
jgi:hypothetical protein